MLKALTEQNAAIQKSIAELAAKQELFAKALVMVGDDVNVVMKDVANVEEIDTKLKTLVSKVAPSVQKETSAKHRTDKRVSIWQVLGLKN